MSLRSSSPLSVGSARLSPSSSHSTSSFYPKPASIPPNKTLHIANLRTGPYNGKTVQEELDEVLSRQLGFCRVKICDNRNLVGCFGVAYFASIQCATDAMNNLQGHPFAGSSKGLRIDYMAQSKREDSSPSLGDDATNQPQGFQTQRRYLGPITTPASLPTQRRRGHLNDLPGPHWGYGPGVSPVDSSPGGLSRSSPVGLSTREIGASARRLGDQAFDFKPGVKSRNMGLQRSIYSDAKATSSISSEEEEGEVVSTDKLKYISENGKTIGLKDLIVVGGVWNKQENAPGDIKEEKTDIVDLLGLDVLPESLSEKDNFFEDGPRQEELKRVMLLGPVHETTEVLETVDSEVVVETDLVSICDGSMEEAM